MTACYGSVAVASKVKITSGWRILGRVQTKAQLRGRSKTTDRHRVEIKTTVEFDELGKCENV